MNQGRDTLDTGPYAQTKRSLHALAELVLAGPRFRHGGSIELRVEPDGFRTRDQPVVAVRGATVVAADIVVELDGLTFADAAARIGLQASRLDDVYSDGPGVDPTEAIHLDVDAVRQVEQALHLGDKALREFHRGAEPTLWPEHFDVAITLDEVNYGVSPGDRYLGRPYGYVGPHHRIPGEFWNAPFGAARPLADLGDIDGVLAFFREGSQLARTARPSR